MLTLNSVSLVIQPHKSLEAQENLDSYLILILDGQHHFLKTVKPDNNNYSWSSSTECIKINSKETTFI